MLMAMNATLMDCEKFFLNPSTLTLFVYLKLPNNQIIVFPNNVILENYHYPYSTTTKSKKGGVAIFVKDNYNVKERHDLNISDKEFEANWIEINLRKSKKYYHRMYLQTSP